MTDLGRSPQIGGGARRGQAGDLSPEWFPQLVTPQNFLVYWNDVDGLHRRKLAQHWLNEGFESESLRRLASLDDAAVRRLTTIEIIEVLRSLGVQFETPEAFFRRCARAIARVQVDLDRTGFAHLRMRPVNACRADDGPPAIYAALPDGNWEPSGFAMEQVLDDGELVLVAAESVTATLAVLARIAWPVCAEHRGHPMSLAGGAYDGCSGRAEVGDGGQLGLVGVDAAEPAWRCHGGDHLAAPLGGLTRSVVAR